MNSSNPNYHLYGEFYFTNKSGQVFSFQLTHTPTLSISMSEEKLQNGNEGDKTTQITNKEMTSMNEAIAFILQLVHQKTLEGYTLVDASKREQNKELNIKNDNISEMPLEISSNPSEGSLSPCNFPSKSPSSQTEYLLVSEKDSKSDGKSVDDQFEVIERKESEECKDFGQENAPIVPNNLGGQAFKIIDLEKEDFDDNIRAISCSSAKQDLCTEEVSISTFHRVNKEAILKKAEELNIKCDFRYYMIIISGLNQNINEFKNYLYQVEVSTKEALYPKYWDLKDTKIYSEVEVAHDSKEFEEITSLMTKYFVRAKVLRLVRAQNNYLMTHYITNLNMRQEVTEGKLDRKLLFHGTNQVEPSKIYKSFDTGFDIQYAKEGSMFGKGLYFAQHASYSHAFAFPVNVKEAKYQLLIADVFVGKTYKGSELNKQKPPEGFDSMSPGNGFYIICNNFHSYPLYLIEYTMQKKTVRPASPPPLKRIETLPAILPRATEIHKLNFTPIDASANTNMNYLAPPPLQVPDDIHNINKMLEDIQKALKKDETETKLEKIKELKVSQMTRISRLEKLSFNSFSPFNYVFDKILSGSKLNRPPIYNNQLSVSALNRVKKDIIEIQTDTSLDFLFVEQPDETDLSKCILCLIGPPYSAYEGGIFRIEITFPDDYPLNPPLVSFKTKIYHPCIDDAGNICLGLLGKWTPSGSVKQIGLLISALLDNPLLEEPLLPCISSQYETNRQSFVSQARSFTQKYAE